MMIGFKKWPPRFQAFSIHFTISFIIFLALLAVLVFLWFPKYLFNSDGGWEALKILVGVDLVLGPLLTLIVFKPGKKTLKLDLTLIALMQITCLAIGITLVYLERPLAVVFSHDRFVAVSQGTFDVSKTDSDALKDYPNTRPRLIYVLLPEDEKEARHLRMMQIKEGSLHVRPDFFAPYTEHAHKIPEAAGIEIATIFEDFPDGKDKVQQWLDKKNYSAEAIVWVPYEGRYKTTFLVLDKKTGTVLGQIPNSLNKL